MKYAEPFPFEAFEAWEAQKMEMYENYFFEPEMKEEDGQELGVDKFKDCIVAYDVDAII